jgi:hypothetical protein
MGPGPLSVRGVVQTDYRWKIGRRAAADARDSRTQVASCCASTLRTGTTRWPSEPAVTNRTSRTLPRFRRTRRRRPAAAPCQPATDAGVGSYTPGVGTRARSPRHRCLPRQRPLHQIAAGRTAPPARRPVRPHQSATGSNAHADCALPDPRLRCSRPLTHAPTRKFLSLLEPREFANTEGSSARTHGFTGMHQAGASVSSGGT